MTNKERAIGLVRDWKANDVEAIERALDEKDKEWKLKLDSVLADYHLKSGFIEGQRDMRKRAAKKVVNGFFDDAIAEAIRALPIEGE